MGATPGADIALAIDTLDLDGFVPAGTVTPAWLQNATNLVLSSAMALKLDLKAGKLRLNGTEAEMVALDARASAEGASINNFSIGKVEGAKLAVSGKLKRDGEAVTGDMQASVVAEQPRGLLRLFGLLPGTGDPIWLGALGATDLAFNAKLEPKDGTPSATLHFAGQSGDLDLDGTLALSRGLDWRTADIAAVTEVKAKRGAALAALVGLRPVADGGLPGQAALTLTGTLDEGLAAALDGEAFGAAFSLDGKARRDDSGFAVAGTARVETTQASDVWQAVGCGGCGAGSLRVDAAFEADANGVRFGSLKGDKNGGRFEGELSLTPDLSVRGDIAVAEAKLGDLLSLTFLRWDGSAPAIEAPLTARLPLGLTGEIWIRPKILQVYPGLDVTEAQVGISAVPGEMRLAISSPGDDRRQVAFELGTREQPNGVALDGRLSLPFDLGQSLKSDGRPVATGVMRVEATFASGGRSAAAALAELKAEGGYQLKSVKLAAIDAPAFLAAAEKADSGAALRAALTALVAGTGLDVADRSGGLSAANGAIGFLPVNLRDEDATISIVPRADLPSGVITLDTTVSFDGAAAPPPLTISHAGAPTALTRTIDAGKTMSEYGLRILRKGVDELERLQREQERQAAEEEAQRRKDAERVADWEAHRQELARRQRELRTFSEMRTLRLQRAADAERQRDAEFEEMNRDELDRRVGALRAYRNLRRATAALERSETPLFGSETDRPKPVPKPRAKRKPPKRPAIVEEPGSPIVLVPPDPSFVPEAPEEKPKFRRNFNIQ
jgi:hypothetical protein